MGISKAEFKRRDELFALGLKFCVKCGEIKELKRFRKSNKAKHGRQCYCNECKQNYEKTDKAKELSKARELRRKSKDDLKVKARAYINHALRDGRAMKSEVCEVCGDSENRLTGHHWSYEEKHWIDVVWCCDECHTEIHQQIKSTTN